MKLKEEQSSKNIEQSQGNNDKHRNVKNVRQRTFSTMLALHAKPSKIFYNKAK